MHLTQDHNNRLISSNEWLTKQNEQLLCLQKESDVAGGKMQLALDS